MTASLNKADHEKIMCPYTAVFHLLTEKIIHEGSTSNLLKYSHFLFQQLPLRTARKVKGLIDVEVELAVLFRPPWTEPMGTTHAVHYHCLNKLPIFCLTF